MKYNINILNDYVERGLLVRQKHPRHPIWVYNYSRECQITNAWDDITLSCRAIVIDEEGVVIAKSFEKFFNYEQLESVGLTIPDESFDVYEKMDGSLIIVFCYKTEWIVMSHASFTSDYAIKGRDILETYPIDKLNVISTYAFELLWTKHPIVIVPKEDDLVMLAEFDSYTGIEIDIQTDYYKSFFHVVKKYDGITDYNKIKETIGSGREGCVVRFKSGFRMKIKGDEYFRLHKIITNTSSIRVWETLSRYEDINKFFENVPDEFDTWVSNKIKSLNDDFNEIWETSVDYYNVFYDLFEGDFTDRKSISIEVNSWIDQKYRPILYKMFDDKFIDDIIWKYVKPEHETPNF